MTQRPNPGFPLPLASPLLGSPQPVTPSSCGHLGLCTYKAGHRGPHSPVAPDVAARAVAADHGAQPVTPSNRWPECGAIHYVGDESFRCDKPAGHAVGPFTAKHRAIIEWEEPAAEDEVEEPAARCGALNPLVAASPCRYVAGHVGPRHSWSPPHAPDNLATLGIE